MSSDMPIEQIALFIYAGKDKQKKLAGGNIILFSELLEQILKYFIGRPTTKAVVPEQYPMLRTLQFVSDYHNTLFKT